MGSSLQAALAYRPISRNFPPEVPATGKASRSSAICWPAEGTLRQAGPAAKGREANDLLLDAHRLAQEPATIPQAKVIYRSLIQRTPRRGCRPGGGPGQAGVRRHTGADREQARRGLGDQALPPPSPAPKDTGRGAGHPPAGSNHNSQISIDSTDRRKLQVPQTHPLLASGRDRGTGRDRLSKSTDQESTKFFLSPVISRSRIVVFVWTAERVGFSSFPNPSFGRARFLPPGSSVF